MAGDGSNVVVKLQFVQAAIHRVVMVKVTCCWEPKKEFSTCRADERMCVTHGPALTFPALCCLQALIINPYTFLNDR